MTDDVTFAAPTLTDTFKILVVGAFGIGKTTLIEQISQVPVVGTEVNTSGSEAEVKPTTTVGVEYGIFSVGDEDAPVTLLLFGTPGQDRFAAMREVASDGIDGLIVIVDGDTKETWRIGRDLMDHHNPDNGVPTLLVVNRWSADLGAPPELGAVMKLDPLSSAVTCGDVVERNDAHRFVIDMLTLVLSLETEPEEEEQQ